MPFSEFGHLSIRLTDALGVTVSMPVYIALDPSKTLSAIEADLNSVIAAVEATTDSFIEGATLNVEVSIVRTGFKTSPNATAENERTGLFNFKQTGSPYKNGVDLPAIQDALITGGKIDLTAAAITALVNALTVPFTTFEVVSTAIRALTALTDALLTFRKHRKAESRRSIEVA